VPPGKAAEVLTAKYAEEGILSGLLSVYSARLIYLRFARFCFTNPLALDKLEEWEVASGQWPVIRGQRSEVGDQKMEAGE
jgi:hypothetical protein